MLIEIKTTENGWLTERSIELPDNDKLLRSILRSVKKFTEPTAEAEEREAQPAAEPPEEPEEVTVATAPPEEPAPKKPADTGTIFERPRYRGFLLIRCKGCGKIHGTCIKYPAIEDYTCKDCGHITPLDDMVLAELHCGTCGKKWVYKTNVEDADVTCKCIGCGAELTGWWDAKKQKYMTR